MAVYQPDETLLRLQIESLKLQTHTTWTCIIGVDGRDSETADMISAVVGADSRFEIHEFESRVGFYRNFERILELAPRDVTWIALADQDDSWYPHKLKTLIPHLSSYSLVSGQARLGRLVGGVLVTSSEVTSRKSLELGELVLDNAVSGALCIFRPDILRLALPFPKETKVAYHDHWLGLCGLLMEGVQIVDAPVQDYVQHGANVIGEQRSSVAQRFRSLGKCAGLVGIVKALVDDRWKWRVNMCRAALRRATELSASDRRILAAFAGNRINLRLLFIAMEATRSGNVSRLRTAALLIASLLAPAVERKADEADGI